MFTYNELREGAFKALLNDDICGCSFFIFGGLYV